MVPKKQAIGLGLADLGFSDPNFFCPLKNGVNRVYCCPLFYLS